MNEPKPPPAYAMFDGEAYDHVQGLSALSRARYHAGEAEFLSASTDAGIYANTPINLVAAQVHATLAAAWATLATGVVMPARDRYKHVRTIYDS